MRFMKDNKKAESKNTEVPLQHLLDEMQVIFDSVPALIFYKDKENKFIRVNKAFSEIMGMSKERLEGKSLFEFYPRAQAEAYWRDDQEVIQSGKPKTDIIESLDTDKGKLWIRTDKIPYRDAQNNIIGVIGLSVDITKAAKIEQELSASEAKFRVIFDNNRDGLLVGDINTRRFVMGNGAICQMLGYSEDEILHLRIDDIHSGKDLPVVIEQFEKMLQDEIEVASNVPVKRKDGSIFYADITASSVMLNNKKYIMGSFRDVTDRKKAEALAHQLLNEQQIIFDSVPAWIFYKDKENRFIRVNKFFSEMMGKPKEELEGKYMSDIFPKEQAEKYWRDDKEVMASGSPKRGIIEPVATRKGMRWVQTDKIPYRDEHGDIIGIIGFAIDITGHRETEKVLGSKIEALEAKLKN